MQREKIRQSDERVKAATTRAGKIRHIQQCFATQPMGGWSRADVEIYLSGRGIQPKPTVQLSDAEVELIYKDLTSSSMILIKRQE